MIYKLRNKKNSWFTLIEVILVCSVFAILVSWIILAINRAFVFMNNTRLSIRATNFAREWVEMMYNIRDTNRRKCSWEKDKAWLYLGTGVDESSCDDLVGHLFQKWIYILNEDVKPSNDKYIDARKIEVSSENEDDFYSSDWFFKNEYEGLRNQTKLTFTWTYKYLSWDNVETWEINDLLWEWVNFYRIVRVYGIYKKNTEDGPMVLADDTELTWWSPAEMRFCVKVFYESNWAKHESELCSIITNFME